jgi:hypothetical protein
MMPNFAMSADFRMLLPSLRGEMVGEASSVVSSRELLLLCQVRRFAGKFLVEYLGFDLVARQLTQDRSAYEMAKAFFIARNER